jgi:RimJ/RimL family protein N-acetyltransferase
MNKWLQSIELVGNTVKLIPLNELHKEDLLKAASDGELWKIWHTSVPSKDTISEYIEFALNEQNVYRALPFVVIVKASNKIIGSTRFCNANSEHKRLEIGYTWYAQSSQRTVVNTECKYLLLKYAFENLDCIAVVFRTNWHNHASRNAISRLGAKQDGVLRNHRIDKGGRLRDTVVFSILNSEWKGVKKSLEFRLEK